MVSILFLRIFDGVTVKTGDTDIRYTGEFVIKGFRYIRFTVVN